MLSASLSYSSRTSCSSGESSGGESSALDPGRSSIFLVALRKLVDGQAAEDWFGRRVVEVSRRVDRRGDLDVGVLPDPRFSPTCACGSPVAGWW